MIEKIFVAWGGNQPLAKLVSVELSKCGFEAIVGGGLPTDLFVGTQIFSQINQCTRAIILAETRAESNVFSSNLMFEWGYMTAKMDPRKLHVFLIGESKKSLPSYLAGIWASEITDTKKPLEQIAQEIVSIFSEAASRPIDFDKIEILNRWNQTKYELNTYNSAPACSEIELAHYILHSVEACYYHMEEAEFVALINEIAPVSAVLDFTLQIVKANVVLFKESSGLTKPLEFDTFSELKTIFDKKFDFSNQDNNLNLWFKYFCNNRLALLNMLIAVHNDFDTEDKSFFYEKSIEYNNVALSILSEIAVNYPQETIYAKLYEGYVFRDLFKIYTALNNDEKAVENIRSASKAREVFYLSYKQNYPKDGYLIKRFGEEYYLSCAELLKYLKDPIEKKIIESTIRSFLTKLETESGRQHQVLSLLRLVFSGSKG